MPRRCPLTSSPKFDSVSRSVTSVSTRPLTDEWADRPSNELQTCRHQPRPLDIAQLAERLGTTDVKRRPVGERRISSLGFHNHFRFHQDTSGELVEARCVGCGVVRRGGVQDRRRPSVWCDYVQQVRLRVASASVSFI